MDFKKAVQYLEAAKSIGEEQGVQVSVAVLDAAGHLVLVARGKEEAWHGPYMAHGAMERQAHVWAKLDRNYTWRCYPE